MREPQPLPEDLAGRPFDRNALERAGLSQGRLRRRDITRPFHGVQTVRPTGTRSERCRAYRVRMKPGHAFSHQTAALLLDLPLPTAFEEETELHVSVVFPAPAPTTRGVVGHRLRIGPPVVLHEGLPVVRPDEAWAQLAPLLSVDELIALGDAILWRRPDAFGLLRSASEVPYRPNGERLRRALREIRVGAASPGETRVRLLLVRAGVPEPELNAEVALPSGVVHPDLVWRDRRVAVEYEGAGHADERQRRYDIERYELLKEAGWTVVLATADSLRAPNAGTFVRRVRALTL
jgi:hypothetical protein